MQRTVQPTAGGRGFEGRGATAGFCSDSGALCSAVAAICSFEMLALVQGCAKDFPKQKGCRLCQATPVSGSTLRS